MTQHTAVKSALILRSRVQRQWQPWVANATKHTARHFYSQESQGLLKIRLCRQAHSHNESITWDSMRQYPSSSKPAVWVKITADLIYLSFSIQTSALPFYLDLKPSWNQDKVFTVCVPSCVYVWIYTFIYINTHTHTQSLNHWLIYRNSPKCSAILYAYELATFFRVHYLFLNFVFFVYIPPVV